MSVELKQGGHKPRKHGVLMQGFLWTWKTQGILREFCATSGKNCNKQSVVVRHWNIWSECGGDLLYCWSWCGMTFDEGHDLWWRSWLHILFVAITYGEVSLWLWKSWKTQGIFSPTLWPPCKIEARREAKPKMGRTMPLVPLAPPLLRSVTVGIFFFQFRF